MEPSPFFVKLFELEQDYQALQNCLQVCRSMNTEELHAEIAKIQYTCDEVNSRLENSIHSSRSPAVSELAQAQKSYYQTVKELREKKLPAYLHSECGDDELEARMLYAEYAIDFARQSICHALIAALTAVDMEKMMKKQSTENRRNESDE